MPVAIWNWSWCSLDHHHDAFNARLGVAGKGADEWIIARLGGRGEDQHFALAPTVPPGRDRPFYNPTPGPDGLNAAQKAINFFENHDDINRFRVRGVSESRNRLANALALTLPGIPCLYYGTEAALLDDAATVNEGAESGRMTFIPPDGAERMREVAASESIQIYQVVH